MKEDLITSLRNISKSIDEDAETITADATLLALIVVSKAIDREVLRLMK